MKFFYPKDKQGNPISFKTEESHVSDRNGKSLTDKLAELVTRDELAEELALHIPINSVYSASLIED